MIDNNSHHSKDKEIKKEQNFIEDNLDNDIQINNNEQKDEENFGIKFDNMKSKILIFIKLIKKYSQIFTNITEEILKNEKSNEKKVKNY